jgi:hypothetical protein
MDEDKGTKSLEELRESVNTLSADLAATERQMVALGFPARIADNRRNAFSARREAQRYRTPMPTFEGTPQERLDKERAWAKRAAAVNRAWLDHEKAYQELVLSHQQAVSMTKDLERRLAYMREVLTWTERIFATKAELEGA